MPLIAVVDDDPAYLKMMNELLRDEGYRTLIHREGTGAHAEIADAQPDLVILDIRMESPGAGWTVLDMLRLEPRTCDIPVVVCSADVSTLRDKEKMLSRQGCAVLEKPFDLDTLLRLVREKVGQAG